MKKIITLLFSLGIVAVSFAQYDGGYNQANDNYAYNRGGQFHHDGFDAYRTRGFQIQKINDDFQNRINSIMNDPYMRRYEKREAIRNAGFERDRQLQFINNKFRYYRNNDDSRYNKDNRQDNW